MKKAEEFIPFMNKVSETVIVSGRQYWNREFIVRLIKQAQLEAVEETVKLCAENAKLLFTEGFWKEDKQLEYFQSGENNLQVSKQSILNCIEILKKEIE